MASRTFGLLLLLLSFPFIARATPPMAGWNVLEDRAEAAGATAVRDAYRGELEALLARLGERPEKSSFESSFRRRMALQLAFEYLRSWALVEARDLRRGKMSAAEGRKGLATLVEHSLEVSRLDQEVRADGDRWRQKADAGTLERMGLEVSLETSLDHDRRVMTLYVALLAKLAGEDTEVERILGQPGGAQSALPRELAGGLDDAEAFLGHDHDVDLLLHLPPAKAEPNPRPPRALEDAMRELVGNFLDAVVRRDTAAMERLFADKSTARSLAGKLEESTLSSVDLSRAHLDVQRLDVGLYRVRIDGVAAVKLRQGRRVETTAGKTFLVELRGGKPLIARIGGAR